MIEKTSRFSDSIRPFQRSQVPKVSAPQRFPDFSRPVDLEIGCGVGLHPLRYGLKHPARDLIAVEHTKEKFQKFERRFRSHGEPQNLFPVHANAISVVTHLVAPSSLDRVFILFPNPEPKNISRRWYAMPFFKELLSRIKPEGTLTLATNISSYFDEAGFYLSQHWGMKLSSVETRSLETHSLDMAQTHFEKKYWQRGERTYWISVSKKE